MKYSLGISNFLKRSPVFPILLFSSISFHWSLRKAFLYLIAILWNSAFKWVYLFSFTFYLSSFLSYLWGLFRWTFCFLHVFFLRVVLNTASCTMSWTFVHNSLGTLSDLTPWIYLSLPLYNCKGFNLGHSEWSSSFPYFLQFKSEFGNKDFMIWATVSSQSYFCWLYRDSPSLASKNITNLILVLTIWWRSLVFSCVVIRDCLLWAVCSLGKTVLAFALLHFVLQSQTCLLF